MALSQIYFAARQEEKANENTTDTGLIISAVIFGLVLVGGIYFLYKA